MRIAIIGAGWVGEKLAAYLKKKGHHVIATTTTPEKTVPLSSTATEAHLLDFTSAPDFSFLESVDVAIFSMPISHSGWHAGFQKMELQFPKTLLFSSTGIYPKKDQVFTEEDTTGLREDLLTSEKVVLRQYPQTNILRFGGLMGGDRSLSKFMKGRRPDEPTKPANYIHYEDILAIVDLLIRSERRSEIYNVVAPEHPTVAEILNLEEPLQDPGKEAAPRRIISSEKLQRDFNYTFIHPNPKDF